MIYLHTGQPGAGKTLLTLDAVRKRSDAEKRPVFYAGIEILKPEVFPGWQLLDEPDKWFEVPDGAIIVHDECQTLYRPRANGSNVPPHVARFETHRHQGLDIYLITQHPMLVDQNIRRLTGEHVHVMRKWGGQSAKLHRWSQVKEQCDKVRGDSVPTTVSYPKVLFGAYKSATVHTHKKHVPARVYFLYALPFLLAAIAYGMYAWVAGKVEKKQPERVVQTHVAGQGQGGQGARATPVKTAAEWAADRRPRVAGLPHSAPVYDQVTQPVRAPYPAGCIASEKRCVCYTQQGTRMDTEVALCRQIAATGYFVDWEAGGRGIERDQRQRQDVAQTDQRQVARADVTGLGQGGYGGVPASYTWGGVPASR